MFNKKTIYSIRNESGQKSSITLPKIVADTLQKEISDVHLWIQKLYMQVVQERPYLSRRKKGNYVRLLSEKKAFSSEFYQEMMSIYL